MSPNREAILQLLRGLSDYPVDDNAFHRPTSIDQTAYDGVLRLIRAEWGENAAEAMQEFVDKTKAGRYRFYAEIVTSLYHREQLEIAEETRQIFQKEQENPCSSS